MAKRIKGLFAGIARKLEKEICPCPVCGSPLTRKDLHNTDHVDYDIREPAEIYQSPNPVEMLPPTHPGEDYRVRLNDRFGVKFDPPLKPGETYEIKTSGRSKNGTATTDVCTIKVGVPLCKNCSQMYDPLTILKRVRQYLLERDGKTYPYLEDEIRKLDSTYK